MLQCSEHGGEGHLWCREHSKVGIYRQAIARPIRLLTYVPRGKNAYPSWLVVFAVRWLRFPRSATRFFRSTKGTEESHRFMPTGAKPSPISRERYPPRPFTRNAHNAPKSGESIHGHELAAERD